jgi:two-component system phosphate regulon sensor histidine kinase PhoR
MKNRQNKTALLLMAVSLLLLTASQWFWLKSEYKEHKRSFYSNSDLLFKETVRGLEDSLVSKMVTSVFFSKVEKPNPEPKKNEKKKNQPKKIQIFRHSETESLKISDSGSAKRVQIRGFQLTEDSLHRSNVSDSLLQTLILSIHKQSLQDSLERLKRIVSQLPRISIQAEDNHAEEARKLWSRRRFNFLSASRDSVERVFNSRIKDLGYDVSFLIEKDTIPFDTTLRRNMRSATEMHKKLRTKQDSIIVNNVQILNPEMASSYSVVPTVIFRATPQKLNDYLYRKLRNNAIFSGFLLLLTGITFFIIYRNLQRQSRLNSIKNDLISNITHELKTPLSTLSVALEALQQFGAQANPKTTKEYLEISQNEVQRLSQMVDNILKTSLLEKQGLSLSPSIVNLKTVTESLVKSWQPRFNQLKGAVQLEITDADFTIEADESQITSIINNLLDNAIKYCKESPQVSVLLKGEPSSVSMVIKDNGIGIPKEYQNQVFDKFFRVPTGDRHNVKGYGLGLNFVKHIMDLHRGLVTLESDSLGTTFTLTFKRKIQ